MEIKLGVRGHDLASNVEPEEFAKIIHDYGFSYLQLVMNKALKNPVYEEEYASRVKKALDQYGIKVAMLGAYFNPVHSDKAVVEKGVATFEKSLAISHLFDAPVGSETGSFNDSPWIYVPKNRTEEGYQQSKGVFRGLLKKAEALGAKMILEPAFGHVMWSVQTLKRLVDEFNSPNVEVTIDLYNLLDASNFEERDAIFHEALETFGDKIKILHLKDGKVVDGKLTQFAPGEGDFHYEFMLKEIKRYCPGATMVFEGVKADKIVQSKEFIEALSKTI